MRIFITGASGYVGLAAGIAFRQAGHHVSGLVRTSEKGELLLAHEIEPVVGEMRDLKSYEEAARSAEVLVHCAQEKTSEGADLDYATVVNLIDIAKHQNLPRAIIYTSGIWVYGNTGMHIRDEAASLNPIEMVKWRPYHEETVLKATTSKLRTVVLRPGCVYGGSGGLTSQWFQASLKGKIPTIEEGNNRWGMVHIHDLARSYVLAAEKELSGVVLNVTDDTHYTTQEMIQAVAAMTGSIVEPVSRTEAEKRWGPLVQGLAIDQQVSNERIKRLLGWQPRHNSFISDLQLYYHCWQIFQKTKADV